MTTLIKAKLGQTNKFTSASTLTLQHNQFNTFETLDIFNFMPNRPRSHNKKRNILIINVESISFKKMIRKNYKMIIVLLCFIDYILIVTRILMKVLKTLKSKKEKKQ